jgi:hypothetical protein
VRGANTRRPHRQPQDIPQHPLRELSGESVLLARVIRREHHVRAHPKPRAVREARFWLRDRRSGRRQHTQARIEPRRPERDEHAR